jgi:ribosome-associated translation inhibitor RaiA
LVALTFRHVTRSGALEARAREVAERLRRYNDGITDCHLTIESNPGETAGGARYAVKIHLSAPGALIHADSTPQNGTGHRDVYAALRDAYASARRQLQELRQNRSRSMSRPSSAGTRYGSRIISRLSSSGCAISRRTAWCSCSGTGFCSRRRAGC